MNLPLKIGIERHPPLAILILNGRLAQLQVYNFKHQVEVLLQEGYRFFVIDLKEIQFIDSAGIGAIAHIRQLCLQAGGQEVIVHPKDEAVNHPIESSQLQQIIECFIDSESAIKYLCSHYYLKDINLPSDRNPDSSVKNKASKMLAGRMDQLEDRMLQMEERLGRIEQILLVLEEKS
jgi:anti-anti-sigma factor